MAQKLTTVDSRCSVARSLEVLGEKWTLLIIREAFWGRTRFAEFKGRLGVAPDILTDRLSKLVAHGIFARQSYRDEGSREREEYVLTEAGLALKPVLASLSQWGDGNRPSGFGPAAIYTDGETGSPVRIGFLDDDGKEIPVSRVTAVRGPGALSPA